MTNPPEKAPKGAPAKATAKAAAGRQDRLAAALRENLHRRKAQARGRSQSEAAPEVEREAGAGDQKREFGGLES